MNEDQIKKTLLKEAEDMYSKTKILPKFIRVPLTLKNITTLIHLRELGFVATIPSIYAHDDTQSSNGLDELKSSFQDNIKNKESFISEQHDSSSLYLQPEVMTSLIDIIARNKFSFVNLDSCIGKISYKSEKEDGFGI